MYLTSHVGRWSTTVIGRFYGGRDHSTVVHSIQRIEAMREVDLELDVLLCDLKSRIGAAAENGEEPQSRTLVGRGSAEQKSDVRMLAQEITAQIREALRDELRAAIKERSLSD